MTLKRSAASNARSLVSSTGRGSQPPALLTRMSSRPNSVGRPRDECLQALRDRHVGGYGEAAATGRADRGGGRVDVGRGPSRAHDVGAGFSEGDRGRGADAASRTGDDRDTIVETESIEDHRRNLPGRPPLPSRRHDRMS